MCPERPIDRKLQRLIVVLVLVALIVDAFL